MRYAVVCAAMLAVCCGAWALEDPNRIMGWDWDGQTVNSPSAFNSYWAGGIEDTEGNAIVDQWVVGSTDPGVLTLVFNTDDTFGAFYWDKNDWLGSGYNTVLDLSAPDVYLVIGYRATITAGDSNGRIPLQVITASRKADDSDTDWATQRTMTVFLPANTTEYQTVVINAKDDTDTDPNTWQGKGETIWRAPAETGVNEACGLAAFTWGDGQGDGGFSDHNIDVGDTLDVDFVAFTTDYTPYLPAAEGEGEGEGEGLPVAGGIGLGLLAGAALAVGARRLVR